MGTKIEKYIGRYIEETVSEDLKRKMVFAGRLRQSGKTILAKHLCTHAGCEIDECYLNWDAAKDREQIILEQFPTVPGLLIIDEFISIPASAKLSKGSTTNAVMRSRYW
jgi:hypothetical protein